MSIIKVQNQLVANNDLGSVFKTLVPGPVKKCGLYGSSNGANAVLCNDDGSKVLMHEILVRRFTNLLDAFDSTSIEELRDPYGSLVIILQGVDHETLQAISHLLYTGECQIASEEIMQALTQILASSVTAQLLGASKIKKELLDTKSEDDDTDVFDIQTASETDVRDIRGHSEVCTESLPSITAKVSEPQGQFEKENQHDVYQFDTMCDPAYADWNEKAEDSRCKPTHEFRNSSLICNKVFPKQSFKKSLEKVHIGERAYHCKQCDQRFSRKCYLKEHESIHTGKKVFICSECDKWFRRLCHLKAHRYKHIP